MTCRLYTSTGGAARPGEIVLFTRENLISQNESEITEIRSLALMACHGAYYRSAISDHVVHAHGPNPWP